MHRRGCLAKQRFLRKPNDAVPPRPQPRQVWHRLPTRRRAMPMADTRACSAPRATTWPRCSTATARAQAGISTLLPIWALTQWPRPRTQTPECTVPTPPAIRPTRTCWATSAQPRLPDTGNRPMRPCSLRPSTQQRLQRRCRMLSPPTRRLFRLTAPAAVNHWLRWVLAWDRRAAISPTPLPRTPLRQARWQEWARARFPISAARSALLAEICRVRKCRPTLPCDPQPHKPADSLEQRPGRRKHRFAATSGNRRRAYRTPKRKAWPVLVRPATRR